MRLDTVRVKFSDPLHHGISDQALARLHDLRRDLVDTLRYEAPEMPDQNKAKTAARVLPFRAPSPSAGSAITVQSRLEVLH
jgi:hypothetical protein